MEKIEAIVFDLGGVLTSLSDPVSTFGFDGSENEFWRRWLKSTSVRDYESGRINSSRFQAQVVEELGLNIPITEFSARMDSWIGVPAVDSVDLLKRLADDYPIGLLSNTNRPHWEIVCSREGFAESFDKLFLSFETGLLKPDHDAFEQLSDTFDCAPQSILYFDDNQMNVEGALQVGLSAVRSRGLKDTSAKLAGFGF